MTDKTASSAVAAVVNDTPSGIDATLAVSYLKADGSAYASAPSNIIEAEATTAPTMAAVGVWRTGYREANGNIQYTTSSHTTEAYAVLFTLTIAADAGEVLDTTTYSLKLALGSDISTKYASIAYKYCDESAAHFTSGSEITVDNDIAVTASAQTFKLWVWVDGLQVGEDGSKVTYTGGEDELFTATFTQNAAA
ncbi:MAG: hypothetical protein IJU64_07120 [Bacilli bacterium]|nr:hypothetical protein [Bacilli bacterium]